MRMKKIIFLAAIFGLGALVSCGNNGEGDEVKNTLEVTRPATVSAAGGDAKLDIKSNTEWTITKSDSDAWFELATVDGYGNADITVFVSLNTGFERSADITVKAGDITRTVKLTQESAPDPNILEAATPANAPYDGGEVTFDITSNIDWTIAEVDASWVTGIAPTTGSENATVTVTVKSNSSSYARHTTLVITSSKGAEYTRNVTVTQNGIPDPVEGTYNCEGWAFLLKQDVAWMGTIAREDDRFVLDKMPFVREGTTFYHTLIIDATDTDGIYRFASNSEESVGTMDYQGQTLEIFQAVMGYESGDAPVSQSYEILSGSFDFYISGGRLVIPEKMTIRHNNQTVDVYTAIGARVILNGQSRQLSCTGQLTIAKIAEAAPMIVVEKDWTVDMTHAEVRTIKTL